MRQNWHAVEEAKRIQAFLTEADERIRIVMPDQAFYNGQIMIELRKRKLLSSDLVAIFEGVCERFIADRSDKNFNSIKELIHSIPTFVMRWPDPKGGTANVGFVISSVLKRLQCFKDVDYVNMAFGEDVIDSVSYAFDYSVLFFDRDAIVAIPDAQGNSVIEIFTVVDLVKRYVIQGG